MRTLEIEELVEIQGGDIVTGLCAGVAMGSAIYGLGLLTNWWNPVGWVSGGFIAVDAACALYAVLS